MTDIEDAPCGRCGKPVHLQHDPPCDHGTVQCPEHRPANCCVDAELRIRLQTWGAA